MGEILNKPSMASGEIAPALHGRVDVEVHYTGLKTCRNFQVRQYGGAENRAGTYLSAETLDSSKKSRLIPFEFNEVQTYAIELSDFTMRIIKDGAEVLEEATQIAISAITQANPGVITTDGAHGLGDGEDVYVANIEGMTELNGRSFRVANKTSTTFELTDYEGNNIDTSALTAYSSNGTVTRIYTVATPWDEDALFQLTYVQSNDVITFMHNDFFPRDVTRTDNDAWTVSLFNAEEGPFKDVNGDESITILASATTGSITLTASSALFDNDMVGDFIYLEQKPNDTTERWEPGKTISTNDIRRAEAHYYKATSGGTTGTVKPDHIEGTATDGDNGVTWQYLHSGFGIAQVSAYNSATSVDATVIKTLPDNVTSTATDVWAKAAWSAAEGYPAAAAYHNQRLVFGGTTERPNGVWYSGTGARTFFGTSFPLLDDESITIYLASQKVNAVRHLIPLSGLVALTSNNEQLIGSASGVTLATDPPGASVQGESGAAYPMPIIIGSTVLFVQNAGSAIRTLKYRRASEEDSGTYTGFKITTRSAHLFRKRTVQDWGYQREPSSIVWVAMSDGSLLGLTFLEEDQVIAWHRHDSALSAKFESVCCIQEGDETAVYFVVKRTIGGVTKRFIERMASRQVNNIRDGYFVDCGLTFDGRNYTIVRDLDGVLTYEATTSVTMTITGGTTWDTPEELTITASEATFKSTDVGDQVVFWQDNIAYRITITGYTSSTIVTGIPTKAIHEDYRGVAFTTWEIARDVFRNLNHLEGQTVIAMADGNVVTGLTVSNGAVTLPHSAAVVHIGLQYTSTLETLNLAGPQGSLKNRSINIPRLFVDVEDSRSIKASTDGGNTYEEYAFRDLDMGYDQAVPLSDTTFEVETQTEWSNKGSVILYQENPEPCSINSISFDTDVGLS